MSVQQVRSDEISDTAQVRRIRRFERIAVATIVGFSAYAVLAYCLFHRSH